MLRGFGELVIVVRAKSREPQLALIYRRGHGDGRLRNPCLMIASGKLVRDVGGENGVWNFTLTGDARVCVVKDLREVKMNKRNDAHPRNQPYDHQYTDRVS